MQFTHHCHSPLPQRHLGWEAPRLAVKPMTISNGWLPMWTAIAESEERTS
jgi:hypothetical protein